MKKLISLIVVLSILTSIAPVAPVHANVPTKYKYNFTLQTGHTGTSRPIYFGVSTYGEAPSNDRAFRIDGGFPAGSNRSFSITVDDIPPWRMNKIVYWVESGQWQTEDVYVYFPNLDGTVSSTIYDWQDIRGAVYGQNRQYRYIGATTQRNFTDIGSIDTGGGEFYLDADSTGLVTREWDRKVKDQYGHYDVMQYEDAPIMTYILSDYDIDQDWLTFQQPSKTENFKLEIDKELLHQAMVDRNKAELSVTYRIAMLAESTSTQSLGGSFPSSKNEYGWTVYSTTKIGGIDYYYKDVTYTFYRSIFDLGDANISETATFSHATDHRYLNRKLADVDITVDLKSIHRKTATKAATEELITNLQATPVLYLGNSTATPLATLTMTKLLGEDGKPSGTLQFTGKVPMDVSEVESEGILLQLEDVSTHLMKENKAQPYYLEKPTAESNSAQRFYFSTHKVDTKTPTIRLTDEFGMDLTGVNAVQNNVKKEHQFYAVASETLYPEGNVAHTADNQGYFKYELYKKTGDVYEPATTSITNFDGTGSTAKVTAPISTQVLKGVNINLRPVDRTEGEFKLRLYGWDKADNPLGGDAGYAEIDNIKLDNQAPRVTVHETVQPQDVQSRKRNDYRFEMKDYQQSNGGWSRTYYTFMSGTAVPPNTPIDEISLGSQEISSTQGMWAFVDSKGESTTALLSIPKGDSFDGSLYYFTVDSLGNDSRNEQVSKYYTKKVQIFNDSATDTIITTETSSPKPSFNITFDVSDPNIETSYRWKSHPNNENSFTQNYAIYQSSHTVGAANKNNSSGKQVLMDGTYTLEYRVTNKRSGNISDFSREFIYDNKSPEVSFVVGKQHDHLKSTQQFSVKVTDASGVTSAHYYLARAGTDTKIENTSNYPLDLKLNSDGVMGVNETLTMTGLPSGAYSVVVVATDLHGRESKEISPYFGMRSEAAIITTMEHAQAKTINGMGATSDGSYDISVVLNEPHVAWTADSSTKYQNPVYYVTADGMSSENGVLVPTFTASNDQGGKYEFTLKTPMSLTEGINTIYLQFGLLNHPADHSPEFFTEIKSIDILYDSLAPTFELPDYSTIQLTNSSVSATIAARDTGSGINKLTVAPELADKITISPYKDGAFTVTISENVSTNLVLSDKIGNSVLVPIAVSNIDKVAPKAVASSEVVNNGAREDGLITVNVSDESDTNVSFALIEDPAADHALTDADYALFSASESVSLKSNVIANEQGNKQKTYAISLKGLSGTYAIGIKAVDIAGNVTEKLFYNEKLDLVDAEAEISNVSANPAITKTTSTVTVSFNVPVTVMPNTPIAGDVVETMLSSDLLYKGLLSSSEHYTMDYDVVIQNNNEISLYIQDEIGRDQVVKFTPTVEFIEGFEITGHVEKNGTVIQNGGFISYKPSDKLYYVVVPNPKYSGQYFFVENAKLSGLKVNTSLSVEDASFTEVEGRIAYSKLVLEAVRNGSTTKSAYFEVYTTEGMEADRIEEAYVAISVVDESAPIVAVEYSNTEPTNQNVDAKLTISDPESGIAKFERSEDGTNFEQLSSSASYTEKFEQNGTVYFRVTNNAGMVTTESVTVSNIDKTVITEGEHYTIAYTYENYLGNWVPITDGRAYRKVTATVKQLGDAKTITMTNNSGSFSRTLTEDVNTFTFEFRDQFGNTNSRSVSYNHFDNTIGQTSYMLSSTSKTNQNIYATITITDDSEEISFAEVKKDGVVYPFKGEPLENEYVVELDSSGIYYVTAYDYAGNKWTTPITVSNINKVVPIVTAKAYSTLPTEKTYQSINIELTQFNKDIKTIKVTDVEPVGNLTYTDIVYIPGSKAVRLKKNGTVTMSFVDDYGNEGHEVITVSNIVTTPPQVSATATLASDKLSVNVAFDQIRDNDGVPLDMLRKMEDLTVSYRGYEYALVTEVKNDDGDVVSYEDTIINIKTNGEHVFQVRDQSGLTQKILLTIAGIEVGAPKVKEIRWSYKYLVKNQAGQWVEEDYQNKIKVGVDTSGKEEGYVVGTDKNPITNQDVNVTVVTDKDAKLVGGKDVWELDKSMNYSNNGLYIFNLQGRTGEHTSYGVNIGLIDKTPPELKLNNGEELIFIEGMTSQKDASLAYDKSKLLDFEAWDMVANKKIDLTGRVSVNYNVGGRVFNPDKISANDFNRANPYYVDYTVRDDAGNQTTIRRTIRLVGLYDTIALVNGVMPSSSNVATVNGNKIEISLKNFVGISYARYEKGMLTQGQMKTKGTVLRENNGVYTIDNVTNGWYTVYIQTDKRDYFNISVYVSNKGGK